MKINRIVFKPFTEFNPPVIICPKCCQSVLRPVEGMLRVPDVKDGLVSGLHAFFEDERSVTHFQTFFRCADSHCPTISVVQGTCEVEMAYDENNEPYDYLLLSPKSFEPAPMLIAIPEGTPNDLSDELRVAEALMWADPSAATNRLRVAYEKMMDEENVPMIKPGSSNPKDGLTLHERLELYAASKPEIQDLLIAGKWIGNAGSHSSVTLDQACDGFDITEQVLNDIYGSRYQTIALAKQVIAQKGPVSKK